MHFLTVSLLLLPFFSPVLGQGVQVASENGTYGVAAYFTEGGPSAYSICGLANNQTCNAFRSLVASAIAVALYDLTQLPLANESIPIDDPEPTLSTRVAQTEAGVRELLDAMDQSYGSIAQTSPVESRLSRRRLGSDIHVSDARVGNAKYDMVSTGLGTGAGGVAVTPSHGMKRDATYSSAPGFKLTFQNYPQNLANGSLQVPAQILTLCNLAVAMANDWVDRANTSRSGSRYIGVYGQNYTLITALEIIPEIQGYGLNQENPNDYCGPLESFVCQGNTQCQSAAAQPSGTCSPLSTSSDGHTSSAATSSLSLASSTSLPTLPAYAVSALLADLSSSSHPQPIVQTSDTRGSQASTSFNEKPSNAPPTYQDSDSSSEEVPAPTTVASSWRDAAQSSSGPSCN